MMQSHQVDISFVKRAISGDKQAFGQLVREHQSMVYSVCRSIVRNHHDEESVLRRELVDAVKEAIESLPDKDRQVIKAHIDGLKPDVKARKIPISATQQQPPKRKITATKFAKSKSLTISKAAKVEAPPQKEEIPTPEEVPTAQNSDDEIRAFLDWLLSLEEKDTSDETEIDDSDVEYEHVSPNSSTEPSALLNKS